MSDISPDQRIALRDDRVELRLALVCSGGVSLAIYEHGVTKELQKLLRASRKFDESTSGEEPNPFRGPDAADSEYWYYEALRQLAHPDEGPGRPISVSVDVIGGTSAGGINGVALAKAMEQDASQDALTDLWLNQGDLRQLLRASGKLGPAQTAATLIHMLKHLKDTDSPLKGELMSNLLFNALTSMDEAPGTMTLRTSGTSVELYVTATDLFGYEILVPSGTGGASQRDRGHAQVLQFATDPDLTTAPEQPGTFGPSGTAALAFAGRATASFPGAFRPISINTFNAELGESLSQQQLNDIGRVFRYQHPVDGTSTTKGGMNGVELVDGGVLDNTPFNLVIDAIAGKKAETEVARRLVYIEPDPGTAPDSPNAPETDQPEPPYLDALIKVVLGVRGSHSTLTDLFALRDLNQRISEIGEIARQQEGDIATVLAAVRRHVLGPDEAGAPASWLLDKATFQQVSDQMHVEAQNRLGVIYPTYQRLKLLSSVNRLADEIALSGVHPPDSTQSSFVRAALSAWIRTQPYWDGRDQTAIAHALELTDLPYRERRLRFLIQGLNDLYHFTEQDRPPRSDLNALKKEAWQLLDQLRTVPSDVVSGMTELTAFLNDDSIQPVILEDPARFVQEHAQDFTDLFTTYGKNLRAALGDGGSDLWRAYAPKAATWSASLTPGPVSPRELLPLRYLAFPLWDGIIFPTIALSHIPQFTPITVAQFSPLTARVLTPPTGADGKLEGTRIHHFGGFFHRQWRQNDYLWGRLDAAELLLRTLHETAEHPQSATLPHDSLQALAAAGGPLCTRTLQAIIDSEHALDDVHDLRTDLTQQLRRTEQPTLRVEDHG